MAERPCLLLYICKGGETMTDRQRRFCEEYLIDCNATQAAIRAGYSPKGINKRVTRMMSNDGVQAYISEHLERLHSKRTADAQEVVEYLTAVMRGEHREQVLALAGEGTQEIVKIDVSARERLKAAELLGKRYGMFKDGVSIEGAVPIIIKDDLKDDQ